MEIGFTGTQKGMTKEQFQIVLEIIETLNPKKVHHGDCIGADYHFHEICNYHAFNHKTISVVIHPPKIALKRAYCRGYELSLEPKDYLDRNKDIVEASNILIATPGEKTEQLRSGTWSTIRYARKLDKPRIIVLP